MALRSTLLQVFLIAMTSVAFGESEPEAEKFSPETATSLTEAQAQACLKSKSKLRFPRLEAIEPRMASIVAGHRHGVEMNALVAIDPPTAEALAQARESLAMNGLKQLDDQSATALAKCQAPLQLKGLVDLTSVPLASKLASQGKVELPNIAVLKKQVLQAFCTAPCDLYLPGIVALQPDDAVALRQHHGVLDLDGLRNPNPETMACILRNQGPVGLGSVTILGNPALPAVLLALTQHPSSLCLNGLNDLTPAEAKAVRGRTGHTDLSGIKNLGLPTAKELVNCNGMVWLLGVEEMGRDVVQALLKHKPRPGTGFVFSSALHGNLLPEDATAFEDHEGLNFGNPHSP